MFYSNLETIQAAALSDVEADTRDTTGNNWGRVLSFHDRDTHTCSMPMFLMQASELRGGA